MPASRSAKEICREDPDSISCKVAKKKEARAKKYEEEYGDEPETEAVKPEPEPSAPPPKPATERQKYLDELEEKAGSK
jgi:hypothetical protein